MSRVYPAGQRAEAEYAYHSWLTLYNGAYQGAKPVMRKMGLLEGVTTRTKNYHIPIPPVALGEDVELHVTENLRPTLDEENLAPARDEIHDLFLKHVMMQAPGYKKLMSWVGAPIMPTPAAVGHIIRRLRGSGS